MYRLDGVYIDCRGPVEATEGEFFMPGDADVSRGRWQLRHPGVVLMFGGPGEAQEHTGFVFVTARGRFEAVSFADVPLNAGPLHAVLQPFHISESAPHDVFICFSGGDRKLAHSLTLGLRDRAAEVFYDEDTMSGNKVTQAAFREKVRSSSTVCVIVSPFLLSSESAVAEVEEALKWSNLRLRVLPIFVDLDLTSSLSNAELVEVISNKLQQLVSESDQGRARLWHELPAAIKTMRCELMQTLFSIAGRVHYTLNSDAGGADAELQRAELQRAVIWLWRQLPRAYSPRFLDAYDIVPVSLLVAAASASFRFVGKDTFIAILVCLGPSMFFCGLALATVPYLSNPGDSSVISKLDAYYSRLKDQKIRSYSMPKSFFYFRQTDVIKFASYASAALVTPKYGPNESLTAWQRMVHRFSFFGMGSQLREGNVDVLYRNARVQLTASARTSCNRTTHVSHFLMWVALAAISFVLANWQLAPKRSLHLLSVLRS